MGGRQHVVMNEGKWRGEVLGFWGWKLPGKLRQNTKAAGLANVQ